VEIRENSWIKKGNEVTLKSVLIRVIRGQKKAATLPFLLFVVKTLKKSLFLIIIVQP
jgi:hypothetical protein